MKKKDSAESSARVTPLEADTPDVEIVSPESEEDDDIIDPLDDNIADGGEVLDVDGGSVEVEDRGSVGGHVCSFDWPRLG